MARINVDDRTKFQKTENSKISFREKLKNFIERDHVIILSLVIIVFLISFIISLFFGFNTSKSVMTCGDGTFYGQCSLNKPYYCSQGILIENPSICGCPDGFASQNDSCANPYKTNPKNVTLKYTLLGQDSEFNFTVYQGFLNYFSNFSDTVIYYNNITPSRTDFKLKTLNDENQRQMILPLVIQIQNLAHDETDQLRIATSIVQNIQWGDSNKTINLNGIQVAYSKHPYEILNDLQGVCGEKSELLASLLKEMNYNVAIFYNQPENHESIGVGCPVAQSWDNTGYCFIETSGPAVVTDNSIIYSGGLQIKSVPQVLRLSGGKSLGPNLYEYDDAKTLMGIRGSLEIFGKIINPIKSWQYNNLVKKYGLAGSYNSG